MALMKYSSDEATIKQKMKLTFEHRRRMVLDGEKSSDVLTEFPRFKDVKGLVIKASIVLKVGINVDNISSTSCQISKYLFTLPVCYA